MSARAAIPTLVLLALGIALAWQIPRLVVSLGIGATTARADDSWYSDRLLAFSPRPASDLDARPGAGLLLLGNDDAPFTVPVRRSLPAQWSVALAFASALESAGHLRVAETHRASTHRVSGRLALDPSLASEYQAPALDAGLLEDGSAQAKVSDTRAPRASIN